MIDFAAPKAWRFDDVVRRFDVDDTLRDALALGLGANPIDPHQLRSASDDAVRAPLALPTFAVVLGYPGSWMQNPATGIDFTKPVHSEDGVVRHAPIPARLPADGCNVFACSIHHAVLPSLQSKLPYNIEKDFAPVTFRAMFPIVLVAHPPAPVRTVVDVIALEQRSPGTLSYVSVGTGGGTHLAEALFNMQAGTKLLPVPYKGSAPAMTDLLGDQVQLMVSDAPTALPQIKAGKVRAIPVSGSQRSALLPEVPTVAESGQRGYESYSWAGFVEPAGTPRETVERLSADIGAALSDPAVMQRRYEAGAEAMPTLPQRFGQMLHTEIQKWGRVVRTAHIQPS